MRPSRADPERRAPSIERRAPMPYIAAMSLSAQRALHRSLQDRSFPAVYYLHGEDDFLKDQAVRDIVEKAVDPATRDFNLELRRGAELDAETLDTLLATPPMMAERRVVVVRDVGALKKDARQMLDRYLARPAADTVLVLVTAAGAKADKRIDEADGVLSVNFAPLDGDRLPKWIVHHATTQLGATITPEAVSLLQAAVGGELPQLAAELDKLASYANGAEIDEAAVAAVVGVRRGETMGDLLDRIAERDGPGALALVEHVLAQPKTSAVQMVMAIATQTLAIAWARAARDRGLPASALEREFFGLLKETGAFPMRPWGEAAKCWAKAVARWDQPSLDRGLEALLAADHALKESRVSSEEQVLATLVLTLCTDARRAAA